MARQIEFRVATEYSVVKVNITVEGEQRLNRLLPENKCLGCERVIKTDGGERTRRGCCDTCYSGIKNAVKKKRVTEKELMEQGKLLKGANGGRQPRNAFTASINNREMEKKATPRQAI